MERLRDTHFKVDHFYIFVFAFEAKALCPKFDMNMIKASE